MSHSGTEAQRTPAAETDVLILGAGPVGLTLANYLGLYGVRTVVVEQLDRLIDYPRGVGIDDECLRAFQAIGLVAQVRQHTAPDHAIHFVTPRGRTLFSARPSTREFGWARRNSFVQPLVDNELFKGLHRFECVQTCFGWTVETVADTPAGATANAKSSTGEQAAISARYIIGCDGGRSTVRKAMQADFQGTTESTQWLVVDLADDPVGTPSIIAVCHPLAPYISIGLPHGVRRFEFLVPPDATEASLAASGELERLLRQAMGEYGAINVIRHRIYTHHARVASAFRKGRLLLAGDAAHLMPVWQGQGYNTGIRDAANLGWKLARVIRGESGEALLDSYDDERREHVMAITRVSVTTGRIIRPPTRVHAWLQSVFFGLTQKVPGLRNFFLEMGFKPMPMIRRGVVVHDADPPHRVPVGRMFIQPWVEDARGIALRLDDAIDGAGGDNGAVHGANQGGGPGFALLSWGADPAAHLDNAARRVLSRLHAKRLVFKPACQRRLEGESDMGFTILFDRDGELHRWFDAHRAAVILLRPDRFIAMACRAMDCSKQLQRLAASLHFPSEVEAGYGATFAVSTTGAATCSPP